LFLFFSFLANFSQVLAQSISEEKERKQMGPRRGKPAAQPQGGVISIGKLEDFQDDYTALPFAPMTSFPSM
jgi:hypothetical protein